MKCKLVIILLVLLAVSLTSAYAGSDRRLGTDGAQELVIPIGSRGTAMGGAVVASTYGVESMFWNPAGLADMEGTEAMFSHLPYLADINVNFAGVATRIEGFGTLGAGAKVVSIGNIQETTEQYPNGTGREFSPSLTVINVSYARILTANVSFGATAMFINEDIFEVKATGVAFDVGFKYDPRWKGVSIGLAIKNYGPEMSFSGRGFNQSLNGQPVRPEGASFDLPSSINMGMAWEFLNQDKSYASVSGNFRSNNYTKDYWQGGAEYVYDGKYSLRAGYTFQNNTDYLYGASLGAGVQVPLGTTMLTFEYSWNQTDVFDDNQFFTVKANF
ncbi:MAG TPA: PorV/PorQ family protein [candidate division Zixibacteria bacterium]|nr:PorV/PorQ family protein [candidate division Zixibacteria bacterium]